MDCFLRRESMGFKLRPSWGAMAASERFSVERAVFYRIIVICGALPWKGCNGCSGTEKATILL